jgi:hypothetical protein
VLVRERQEVQEVSRRIGAGVELHDLVKSWGPIEAVRGINVSVQQGETVALREMSFDPTEALREFGINRG